MSVSAMLVRLQDRSWRTRTWDAQAPVSRCPAGQLEFRPRGVRRSDRTPRLSRPFVHHAAASLMVRSNGRAVCESVRDEAS